MTAVSGSLSQSRCTQRTWQPVIVVRLLSASEHFRSSYPNNCHVRKPTTWNLRKKPCRGRSRDNENTDQSGGYIHKST